MNHAVRWPIRNRFPNSRSVDTNKPEKLWKKLWKKLWHIRETFSQYRVRYSAQINTTNYVCSQIFLQILSPSAVFESSLEMTSITEYGMCPRFVFGCRCGCDCDCGCCCCCCGHCLGHIHLSLGVVTLLLKPFHLRRETRKLVGVLGFEFRDSCALLCRLPFVTRVEPAETCEFRDIGRVQLA